MLVYCFLFLLFLRPESVYSFKDSVNLEIDRPDEQRFKVENSQLDNVFYKHFTPLSNILVKGVNEFTNKIWESTGVCKCVYTLVAYKDELPQLLYLKTDCGHSLKEHFYKKSNEIWENVDVYEYSNSVFDLRKSSRFDGNFGLNLFNAINSKYYTTEYSSKDRPYTFFTANYGYFCTNVYYKSKELWKAKVYGDRCVAVWAYVHDGQYYMIRLLVSEHSDQSKIITYFYIQNQWVHVHTLEEDYGKTVYVQRPENLLYPNYTFNSKRLPLSIPPPLESATHKDTNETVEDRKVPEVEAYLNLTDVYYKPKSPLDLNSTDGSSNNEFEPLDLSSVSNLLFTSSRCVDNVEYKTYSPTKNTVVTKVVQDREVVWESRNKLERCVYALAPQKDGNAVSLYLLLNVNGELRQAFMDKVDGKWIRSNYEDYKKKLKFLKGFVTNYDFSLDLGNKKLNSEYSVEIKLGRNNYFFFTPRLGFACRSVTYKNKTVWESGNSFDKCVAAWSYESYGNVYYVRLLIQYYDDSHDLLSYLYSRNEWEWISSYNYSRLNKTRYSKLLDFYHPEYDFNSDVLDYEFEGSGVYPPSHETKSEGFEFKSKNSFITPENSEYKEFNKGTYYSKSRQTKVEQKEKEEDKEDRREDNKENKEKEEVEDKQEKLDKTTNTNEYKQDNALEPMDPDNYQPVVKVVRQKDCLQLDVSKRLDNYQYENSGVFDGKLNLVTYLPPPGKYFDLVTDGSLPLFIGFRLSHLCKAVNFYTKNKEFYLADVLVKVKNEDSNLYFRKENELWYVISQKRFLELLNELKNSNNGL